MKKRLLSAFLAIVIALSCFGIAASAFNETLYAKDYLEYYVPTVENFYFESGRIDRSEFTYDSAGRLTKDLCRRDYPNGNAWTKIAYAFDPKGSVTEFVSYRNFGSGNYKTVYKYDSSYRLKKATDISLDNGEKSTCSYTYDSKGRLAKKVNKDAYSYSDTIRYSYNSDGLRVKAKETVISGSNESHKSTSYKYNSKGRVTEIRTFDDWLGNVEKYNYKYDSKGNTIKKTRRTSSGLDYAVVYEYDSAGRLVSEVRSEGDGSSEQTSYVYNSKGKLVKTIRETSTGNYSVTKNTFDSHDNAIKTVYSFGSGTIETAKTKYKKLSKPVCETKYAIRLSKYQYKYNGSARKPAVTVDNGNSFRGIDYKISYSNNVKPGNAKVKVRFINPDDPEMFGRTVTIVFKILPA